jgi:hypothetical protein
MILPTKRISGDRCLLGIGARILRHIERPQTVGRLWELLGRDGAQPLPYDWFILALDLLFLIGAIEVTDGRIRRSNQ